MAKKIISKGQDKADAFLKEFSEKLAAKHGKEIDFILLFGSAARGEFVLGKSDVDLIIQVKDNSKIAEVETFAEQLFWKLDSKHSTQLKKVCSTGVGKSILENLLKAVEKQTRLYKPFEVFGPKDIDWNRGMIKRLDLMPGAILVASQLTLLYKMKKEGKILFGQDIRKEIHPRFTLWEKLKSVWVPQSIAFAAILLSPLLPNKAVGYATKAMFYEIESSSIALHGKATPRKKQARHFVEATKFDDKLLDGLRFYLELKFGLLKRQKMDFIKRAIDAKKNGFKGNRAEAVAFCANAFRIIYATNTAIVLKTLLGRL